MAQVNLDVRAELDKLVEQLRVLSDMGKKASDSLEEYGKNTGKSFEDQTKKAESFMSRLGSLTRNVGKRLGDDFKALMSVEALQGALSLTNQFKGSLKETLSLSDGIRKLGGHFGIARENFVSFQNTLTRGMGQIGASSEAAANVLQGLADTPVRGEKSLEQYAKTATMLASIGREKGNEGGVAKGLSGVLTARGTSPNDLKALGELATSITKATQATGQSASKLLGDIQAIYAGMPQELRKKLGPQALTQVAVAGQVGGPQAAALLKEYFSAEGPKRQALEAQGIGQIFNKQGGIDVEGLKRFSKDILSRSAVDVRTSAKTLGLSDEAAEGLVRLAESADRVKANLDDMARASGETEKVFKDNRTLGENISAIGANVKKFFAPALSYGTQKATDLAGQVSGSDTASIATVAGGGVLAALLAGGGLKGIGKGLFGGGLTSLAKGAAVEQITGQKTIPVYVVNASEIGGGGGIGGAAAAAAGAGGKLAKLIPVVGAAALGFEGGAMAGEALANTEVGKKVYDGLSDAMLNLAQKIGFFTEKLPDKIQLIEQKKGLQPSSQPSRGGRQ